MAISTDYLVRRIVDLATDTTEAYRSKMGTSIHLLEISYNTLKTFDPKLTQAEHTVLIDALRENYPSSTSLETSLAIVQQPGTMSSYAVLVQDPTFGIFLLGKTYASIRKDIEPILKGIAGIGSTPEVDTLTTKVKKIFKLLPFNFIKPVIGELMELSTPRISEVKYEFNKLLVPTSGLLGQASIIVNLAQLSSNFRTVELTDKITTSLIKYTKTTEFLTKIKEDVTSTITRAFVTSLGGKPAVSGTGYKAKQVVKDTKGPAPKVVGYRLPPISNVKDEATSLSSLLAYINTHLVHVISANMGNGDSRDILNYRTGRFASSAVVSNLTQTKGEAIQAFYTYQKNPYATFAKGGQQQSPRSRDPEKLISSSIKEVAANKIATRLRTVLI